MPKQIINPNLLAVKLAKNEDEKIEFANLALRYRLYVSGWCLSNYLKDFRISDNSLDYNICLAFYSGEPVGVCVTKHYDNYFIMFFVKKQYRENGIATQFLCEMQKIIPKNKMYMVEGSKAGQVFSYKNRLSKNRLSVKDW